MNPLDRTSPKSVDRRVGSRTTATSELPPLPRPSRLGEAASAAGCVLHRHGPRARWARARGAVVSLGVSLGVAFALAACGAGRSVEPPAGTAAPGQLPVAAGLDAPPSAAAAPDAVVAARPATPGASIYQLDVPLTGADGGDVALDATRGAPTLVAMVYTTCPAACPLLVQQVQGIFGASGRSDLRVLLVSFDPLRDTPERLRALVERFGLDDRWRVTVSTEDGARQLAAALGVRYRRLPDGEFAHSQVVVLLDADGVEVARGDGGDSAPILAALGAAPG